MKTATEMKTVTAAALTARINKVERNTEEWLNDVVQPIIDTAADKGNCFVEVVAPSAGMRYTAMDMLKENGYRVHVQGTMGLRIKW